MKFAYQHEKLAQARRLLLVPPESQKFEMIAAAFCECNDCFSHLDEQVIGLPATQWIATIRKAMDVSDINGTHSVCLRKAKMMCEDEIADFARAIDELCDYFLIMNYHV